MKFLNLLLLLSILIFLSCSDEITNENDELIKPVIFISGNINSLLSDSVNIEQIEIKNNILTISCSYLGGCEVHSVNLFSEIGFLESSPVQLRMRLTHHAYSDSCNTVINEKVSFDLKSVAALYKTAYRTNKGTILFSIYDSDLANSYIPQPRYDF